MPQVSLIMQVWRGSGPEAGLHWGWMFLYLPLGMWVGMAGIFAGAAFGSA